MRQRSTVSHVQGEVIRKQKLEVESMYVIYKLVIKEKVGQKEEKEVAQGEKLFDGKALDKDPAYQISLFLTFDG